LTAPMGLEPTTSRLTADVCKLRWSGRGKDQEQEFFCSGLAVNCLGADDQIAARPSIYDVVLEASERYVEVTSEPPHDLLVAHLSANTNLGFHQIVRTTVITNVNHFTTSCFVVASRRRAAASRVSQSRNTRLCIAGALFSVFISTRCQISRRMVL